jgi:hypothetical protein
MRNQVIFLDDKTSRESRHKGGRGKVGGGKDKEKSWITLRKN